MYSRFSSPRRLLSLTLLGTVMLHEVEEGSIQETTWTTDSPGLCKANVLAISGSQVIVGGMDSGNKGIFLLWALPGHGEPDSSLPAAVD